MKRCTRLFALVGLLIAACAANCLEARAQAHDAPRFEVGAQFSSLTIQEPSFSSEFRTEPGFGGRFTVNLTDYLAVEAQGDFYPNDNGRGTEFDGGRTTSGLFGVKAGKRFAHFGVFGKARPGFVRFGRTLSGFTVPQNNTSQFPFAIPEYRARTEFATDLGGVLEFYPTRRLVTRFDFGDTIIRYRERTLNFPSFNAGTPPTVTLFPVTRSGEVLHNFQFSAGIGIRF